MNSIIIEQKSVRYEINPQVLMNNMLRQQMSQMNLEDFINHRAVHNEWAVQFSNIQGYPAFYIKQWFTNFGKVSSVIQARASSMMYVNFANEYDARRCVIGLMNHSHIQLRPFLKNNPYNINGNVNGNVFPQQNGFDNFKPNGASSFVASNHQKNSENFFSSKNDVTDGNARNVNNSSASSIEDSALFKGNIDNSRDSGAKNCFCQCSQSSDQSIDKIDDDHHSSSISGPDKEAPQPLDSKITFQSREKPGEDAERKLKEIAVKSEEKEEIIITAQEVIVGNIDEAYGVAYILHLLEKYQPICVSDIKTVWKHSVRYCHVYFKTPAHAEAAEANWDDVELNGKKLIVMRPHVLAVQAMQK